MTDFRCGPWQTALADVAMVDAVITDPPYGVGTHEGVRALAKTMAITGQATRNDLGYSAWLPEDVAEFVSSWAPRCRGWLCALTSHDLIPSWEAAYRAAGRYAFCPVPVIQKRPRLVGDGPASWTVYLMVSRPRSTEFSRWGCLPGAYFSSTVKGGIVTGGKPLALMQSIVRDYTKPGDLVCDPCAGGATTLVAARACGRGGVGSELDPCTFVKARSRLNAAFTADLFGE